MSIYNDLVRHDFDKENTTEQMKRLQDNAEEAVSNLMLGISSIGSLMFWASESKDYPEKTAKDDMYRIGLMLMDMGEIVRALNDTAANAEFIRLSKANSLKKGVTA